MTRHRIICLSYVRRSLKLPISSISRHLLVVPRFQLDTYGRHTAVAGPTTWNLFRDNLDEPDMRIDCFLHTLKTFLFEQ